MIFNITPEIIALIVLMSPAAFYVGRMSVRLNSLEAGHRTMCAAVTHLTSQVDRLIGAADAHE